MRSKNDMGSSTLVPLNISPFSQKQNSKGVGEKSSPRTQREYLKKDDLCSVGKVKVKESKDIRSEGLEGKARA